MSAVDLSGARWRKSSYSGGAGNGGDCIEVASSSTVTAMRDSKDAGGPVLVLQEAQWTQFLEVIKHA